MLTRICEIDTLISVEYVVKSSDLLISEVGAEMKNLTITVIALFLFAANATGNVDIVCIDGTPFVTWCTDRAYITSCPSGSPSEPLPLGNTGEGSFDYASVCFAFPAQGDRLIIACTPAPYWDMYPDSVYVLEPNSMAILNQRYIEAADFGVQQGCFAIGELHLPRYCDGSDSFAIVASIGDCTTGYGFNYLTSALMVYPDAGPMPLSDTLMILIAGGYLPPKLKGPVGLPYLESLSLSSFLDWTPYLTYNYYFRSHLHQEAPSMANTAGEMYSYTICYQQEIDWSANILVTSLGSCSSEAVGLWSDSSEVLFFSVFTDDIEPDFTVEMPFTHPTISEPVAMTRNPSDTGLLMAWFQNGDIRVRHWKGEWNDFDHIIASDQPTVTEGNISVCSIDDGYWVVWLPEGIDEPTLEYVDRGSVTALDPSGNPDENPFSLTLSENPFMESVYFTVFGYPLPRRIRIFDITGRLIKTISSNAQNNVFLWDGKDTSGNEVPDGTYFIHASVSGVNAIRTIVKL